MRDRKAVNMDRIEGKEQGMINYNQDIINAKLIFNQRKNASTPKYANTIEFVFSWPSTAGPERTLEYCLYI